MSATRDQATHASPGAPAEPVRYGASVPVRARPQRARQRIMRAFFVLVLLVGAIITLYPFWFMISGSFKTQAELFSLPPTILPQEFRFDNYVRLFEETRFVRWFANSVLVTVARIVLSLFLCSLAGFALAKFRFRFQRTMFVLVVVSIVLPFEVIYIPLYIMMTRLGWVNTYWALIVPWAASALGIFLMRQYMLTLPDELIEAARVDGASGFRIYWQIAVPLAKPAFAALAIVLFLTSWTSFFWPLVILTQPDLFTLPIGLAALMATSEQLQRWEVSMGASVLTSVPLLVVFLATQKYFIQGLTGGATKG